MDYTIFWLLVVSFPRIMIVVSVFTLTLSGYLFRKASAVREFLKEMNRRPPSSEWIGKWLFSWVITSLSGIMMCYYILQNTN